jgi:death-on-curing protein
MTRYLDLESFVNQLQRIGFRVRDLGLLDSALSRPRASLFGQDAYPSIYLKAAALMESIILNHPMIDGNKRSSWFGLNAFLLLNGLVIEADQVEAYEFVLGIPTKKIDIESSANWIEKHSKKL